METLTIATRQSALALWQANHVKTLLEATHKGLTCKILGMTTEGDRNKVSPLSQMGGKGVFVKELETALIDGSADIAVHSMKDVPGELPAGLEIAAIVARASPRDAFVSNHYETLAALPRGSVIGSSSLRRVLQIREAYPGLIFKELRGNVDTRLRKLDEADYDAIILAVAGLNRLELSHRISDEIATDVCIPAAGQGAVGIECRQDDQRIKAFLATIDDEATSVCVNAERRVTYALGATCNLPVAVFGELESGQIKLSAYVSDTNGERIIRRVASGQAEQSQQLAAELGDALLADGAAALIGS